MFGRKKEKKKQKVTTYVEGVEQTGDEPPVPQSAESPALEPQAVQEPTPQPVEEPEPQEFKGECILCFDFRWYADSLGVWHACPRCNKDGKANIPGSSEEDPLDELIVDDKPSKGNLYEFRFCKKCQARHEIHKKKKKWKCEKCGVSQ